jgi:uncharacterized protein YbjT (DUF2867 family)
MFAVLGANGHLGQRLLPELAQRGGVRALVRSEAAARAVRALELGEACEVRVVDPLSADSVAAAIEGVSSVAHLAGILKETRNNRYRDAHEGPCEALAAAAHTAGVQRLVYLSILGSAPGSGNACLASRAAAEQILLDGPVPATVIRVPMVLGEGDYAAVALGRRARRGVNVVLRGASLEQPIYAGDVTAALSNAMQAAGAEVTGIGCSISPVPSPWRAPRSSIARPPLSAGPPGWCRCRSASAWPQPGCWSGRAPTRRSRSPCCGCSITTIGSTRRPPRARWACGSRPWTRHCGAPWGEMPPGGKGARPAATGVAGGPHPGPDTRIGFVPFR